MKKILLIIAVSILGLASCKNGELCPYTSNIVSWSAQIAQDGVQAAQLEQLTQNAIKNKQYDSAVIYATQGVQFANVVLQHKDSLSYYINQCKSAGYSDTTHVDSVQ